MAKTTSSVLPSHTEQLMARKTQQLNFVFYLIITSFFYKIENDIWSFYLLVILKKGLVKVLW